MPKRIFQPGCRLSQVDILVLIVGVVASGYAATVDRWFGIAIGVVILHFFLFGNMAAIDSRFDQGRNTMLDKR